MSRNWISLVSSGLAFAGLIETLDAADNNSEAKLREALRNTMLQLRTAQNDRAALQASQTESEAKIKTLTVQVDKLTKEAAAAEKTASDQGAQLAKFKESVQNWGAAYKQLADLATAKETARAKLANDVISLQRHVADQQTKNAAMFRTANEILTRYERFGLGDALAAKEPFVGITRVKLENLVQDYQDKLLDEKIKESDHTPAVKQLTTDHVPEASTPSHKPPTQNRKGEP